MRNPLLGYDMSRPLSQVLPIKMDGAFGHGLQAGNSPQNAGFAGTIGPDEGDDFTRCDIEGNAPNRLNMVISRPRGRRFAAT